MIYSSLHSYLSFHRQPGIPANASLQYEIELVSVEDAPKLADMSGVDRVKKANEKRERGNSLYAKGDYSPAISSYTK